MLTGSSPENTFVMVVTKNIFAKGQIPATCTNESNSLYRHFVLSMGKSVEQDVCSRQMDGTTEKNAHK